VAIWLVICSLFRVVVIVVFVLMVPCRELPEVLLELVSPLEYLFLGTALPDFFLECQHAIEICFRTWGTAGNIDIDRHDAVDS